MEKHTIRTLAGHDTETRLRMRAVRGDAERGLELLDQLDRRHVLRLRTRIEQPDEETSERAERPKPKSVIATSSH